MKNRKYDEKIRKEGIERTEREGTTKCAENKRKEQRKHAKDEEKETEAN